MKMLRDFLIRDLVEKIKFREITYFIYHPPEYLKAIFF